MDFGYVGRLKELELLPLCLYIEMHDFLMFLSIIKSNFNAKSYHELSDNTTREQSRGFKFTKNRLRISDNNFFFPSELLHNIIIRNLKATHEVSKITISKFFWYCCFLPHSISMINAHGVLHVDMEIAILGKRF